MTLASQVCYCLRAAVAAALTEATPPQRGRLTAAPHIDLYGIPYKSVQELYEKIARGFEHLTRELGERNLFIGKAVNQLYGGPSSPQHGSMNDLNQYDVDIIGVTDLAIAQLFNQCYEVMLLLLLYLYSDQVKTREQTDSLMDAAFFPFMTMFIRPLAEILTEIPAFKDKPGNAGPGLSYRAT